MRLENISTELIAQSHGFYYGTNYQSEKYIHVSLIEFTDSSQSELDTSHRVGADPRTVPHRVWLEWEAKLQLKYIRLVRLGRNLINSVWFNRPQSSNAVITVHPLEYAGEKWQSKIKTLRKHLLKDQCDAMIVTSLTEIAYLLNLRGSDFPYTPVFTVIRIKHHFTVSILYTHFEFTGLSFSFSRRNIFVRE